MEFFATLGRFWLPQQQPRRVVHGSLTFDEDGVRLEVADPLRAPRTRPSGLAVGGSPRWATEPVVHGVLRDGTEVTVMRLRGLSMPAEAAPETWSADFALTGGMISDDEFAQVTVVFDYLMPWAQPPGIIITSDLLSSQFTVETQQVTLAETALSGGTAVRLVTGVTGRWSDDLIHLDQWCGFEVSGEPKPVLEVLNEWARPLQDLLVVCIGHPVRIEHVLLRTPGSDSGREPLKLAFQAVQPPARARPTAADLASYASPALLIYPTSPLPFSAFIGGWFSLCDRLPDVITLLCGPYYAPFIYSGHRYASTFQSAEALARAAFDTRDRSPRQHRARVEAVTAALQKARLDPDIVDWAVRVLQGRNDKPLRDLMEELISSAGELGLQLLAAMPGLAGLLASARTSVSHPGAGGPGTINRYWLGEALTWVLRVVLLAELGVPIGDLSAAAVQKPAFQEILRELRAMGAAEEKLPRSARRCRRLARWLLLLRCRGRRRGGQLSPSANSSHLNTAGYKFSHGPVRRVRRLGCVGEGPGFVVPGPSRICCAGELRPSGCWVALVPPPRGPVLVVLVH